MVKQIKSYIAKGKTKEAIDILQSFETTHPNLEKEILSIRSRYNILSSNIVKGILDNKEINIERANIHNSILIICELVETNEKKETEKMILNQKKLRYGLLALPCLVFGLFLFHSFDKNHQDDTTQFNDSVLIDSMINYDEPSSILSLSAGYYGEPSRILLSAIELAENRGTIIVAAAGNDALYIDEIEYPAFFGNSAVINYTLDPKLSPKKSFANGMVFYKRRDYSTALLNLTKAIQDSTGFVEAYLIRGIINRKIGNHEDAIEDYNKGLEFSPNNPVILYSRSVVFLKINEFDKAMKDCDLAIKINPSLYKAYNSKGHILLSQGYYKEAIVEYNKALELKDSYSYSMIGRGMAKYGINDDSSSYCADIIKAIKLNPRLDLSPFNEVCK